MTTLAEQDGWLASATICVSPNFNQRPPGTEISLLVIHNISLPPGQFGAGHIQEFFCNKLDVSKHPYFETIQSLEVSSHLLIDRGGAVVQFVSLFDRAWHAGRSVFEGCEECNDFSLGIELEGDDNTPYTAEQYQSLAAVTRELQQRFPAITRERITGHSDIAPGRKTDPGPAFDWARYLGKLDF